MTSALEEGRVTKKEMNPDKRQGTVPNRMSTLWYFWRVVGAKRNIFMKNKQVLCGLINHGAYFDK